MSNLLIGDGVRLNVFILCEDVRAETNNKHSILGTLIGDVSIKDIPGLIKFSAYMDFLVPRPGKFETEIKMSFAGEQQLAGTSILDLAAAGHAVLTMPQVVLKVDAPGTLLFECRIKSGKWIKVDKREVTQVVAAISQPAAVMSQPKASSP
jgi:hypothetical protein